MNHYIYKITNNVNGKIYVGKRSCKCDIQDDKYFGSGTRLKYAIKKYGKQNFTKTIIDTCDTLEQVYELERFIVDAEFIKRTDNYNLVIGGPNLIMNGESNPNYGKRGINTSQFGKIGTNKIQIIV